MGSVDTGGSDEYVRGVGGEVELHERRRKQYGNVEKCREERCCRCATSYGPICAIQESIESG